jgi:hypothetical protein
MFILLRIGKNYTTELVSIFLGGNKLWQNEKEQVLSLQD